MSMVPSAPCHRTDSPDASSAVPPPAAAALLPPPPVQFADLRFSTPCLSACSNCCVAVGLRTAAKATAPTPRAPPCPQFVFFSARPGSVPSLAAGSCARPRLHLLVSMYQQLPHASRTSAASKFGICGNRSWISNCRCPRPAGPSSLAHHCSPHPRRIAEPQLEAQPRQQPPEPRIVRARKPPSRPYGLARQRPVKSSASARCCKPLFLNLLFDCQRSRPLKPRMKIIVVRTSMTLAPLTSLGLRSIQRRQGLGPTSLCTSGGCPFACEWTSGVEGPLPA